jgi:MoaA/NifB/PqqE/SkfB family radical SAM enzyme
LVYKRSEYLRRGKTFLRNRMFPKRRRISTLMVYATDLCDSRCQHCLIWEKRPVKYLPMEKVIGLMENRCVTKHTTVGLEGGEFLLHPESIQMMEWFVKNHPRFELLSNCLKPEKLIDAVKHATPSRLFISLDGTKETYQHMRGKDGYDKVINVIESLKSTLPISVMFCLSPWNTTEDLRHVAEVCKKNSVDLRVGVYSNIKFFDTEKQAYTEHEDVIPPEILKEFEENYDYLLLYNSFKKGNLKLTCNSITDTCVVLPNGDVPICLNLDLQLGNIYTHSLDQIYAQAETVKQIHHHQHHCNACWINFHRKFDLILYRQFEKYFPKSAVSKLFGYYQWEETGKMKYKEALKKLQP